MYETQPTHLDCPIQTYMSHAEEPVSFPSMTLSSELQTHLTLGGVGLATMFCMTLLIREIRLLVEACKS